MPAPTNLIPPFDDIPLPDSSLTPAIPDPASHELGDTSVEAGTQSATTLMEGVTEEIAPSLANPNILVIMVDQFRQPCWLSAAQNAAYTSTIIPAINSIGSQAFVFPQFYCNSAPCMPSRASFLTGLYSQQQYMFVNTESPNLSLNAGFPTYAKILAAVNSNYAERCWWFGKWHLSAPNTGPVNPLLTTYGFRTGTYPNDQNPSPNGWPNEGTNGGIFSSPGDVLSGEDFADDAAIVRDFGTWLDAHNADTPPWCTTVSLVNPHDISFYPDWFFSSTYSTRSAQSTADAHFTFPSSISIQQLFSSIPSPWNTENVGDASLNKPPLQKNFRQQIAVSEGAVSGAMWIDLLNYYYTLQKQVDSQVSAILTKLDQYPGVKSKTIIVFTSDHGEYCGSHSLRTKGGAVYDEALRIPLYVKYPGQTAASRRYQMCSSVDFPRLIAELGNNGIVNWATYPNLSYLGSRESIHKFIQSASQTEENRLVTLGESTTPYILHTYDNDRPDANAGATLTYTQVDPDLRTHIVCLRTKTDLNPSSPNYNNGFNGAKYAVYSKWASCRWYPQSEAEADVDHEFYDYGNNLLNRKEMGNDYQTTDTPSATLRDNMKAALGKFSPLSGLIQSELLAALPGGLQQYQQQARQAYLNYISGGACGA